MPVKLYVGRRATAVVINLTMDREAAALLAEYCPSTSRSKGSFVARLLYEHHARQQERERVRQEVEGEGR
jgi:hypothetical protein